jgi:hypothetical protein
MINFGLTQRASYQFIPVPTSTSSGTFNVAALLMIVTICGLAVATSAGNHWIIF